MENLINPVKILETKDWKEELSSTLIKLQSAKPVLVTSSRNKKRLSLTNFFPDSNIFEFDETNPTITDCIKHSLYFKNKNIDCIVAIGGGSIMDFSKYAMAVLSTNITDVQELINIKENYSKSINSIFIPTTHGTGSEVTKWATIWDMDKKRKKSLSNESLYPDFAILDGSLLTTLPESVSIATILDALSHSFEALWNKNSNPISTQYAIESIKLIFQNFDKIITDSTNIEVRSKLLKASTLAGLSISKTQTAAAHSISYPLTIYFDIPHGIACSVTLCSLLQINKNYIKKEIENILSKLHINSFEIFMNKMRTITEKNGKHRLRSFGVKKSDISWLKKECFTKERMANNIVELNDKDVEKVLFEVL